jgi:ribosomal-protein-alanine N-acetyltransferase
MFLANLLRPHGAAPTPPQRHLRAMALEDIERVCAIEQLAYSVPWTRGNFVDSLQAGHAAWVLETTSLSEPTGSESREAVGYCIAMAGVEEMHLLNLTVRPADQGQGHAQAMLLHLQAHALTSGAAMIWLEVRSSNARARRLYEHVGFSAVGVRKQYYPTARGPREDAIVMCRVLAAKREEPSRGLD